MTSGIKRVIDGRAPTMTNNASLRSIKYIPQKNIVLGVSVQDMADKELAVNPRATDLDEIFEPASDSDDGKKKSTRRLRGPINVS